MAMRACLSFKFKNLGLNVGSKYIRIPLTLHDSHIHLPFSSVMKRTERDNPSKNNGSGSKYTSSQYSSSCSSHYQPSHDTNSTYKSESALSGLYTPARNSNCKKRFNEAELLKLHVQLKHASVIQVQNYLNTAELWSNDQLPLLNSVISSCKCRLAFPPEPHAVASTSPPGNEIQRHLAVDVIHLGDQNFLHCIDRITGWSELGILSTRQLSEQVNVLKRIQINKHGVPRTIHCDREYNKGDFLEYCTDVGIRLIPVAANSHESNGAIERANRTLRSFFDRLRLCDQKGLTADIASEAIFGKNINRGNRVA